MSDTVLVLNSGSSSLKYQLVQPDTGTSLAHGIVERIGSETSTATLTMGRPSNMSWWRDTAMRAPAASTEVTPPKRANSCWSNTHDRLRRPVSTHSVRRNTAGIVSARIFMSSASDQFSM